MMWGMATAEAGAAVNQRLRIFLAVQVGVPLALLLHRLATGEVDWYGFGWQMYSYLTR